VEVEVGVIGEEVVGERGAAEGTGLAGAVYERQVRDLVG
jgi:hypothetical protein